MNVQVKAYMSGDPIATTPEASALDALRIMVERAIRHLPVVDGARRVVGVLSRDDLSAALVLPRLGGQIEPREMQRLRQTRVADVMSHVPETVGPEASIAEAADRMADRRIGCLPVVDPARKLVGLLSETDLLRALATTLWAEELREKRGREGEADALVADLRRERARIAEQLDALHATERELSAAQHDVPMDDPERAADLREVRLSEKLDALAARRLAAIDAALDHAAQGRLSICERCGGSIPVARLRALPGTTLCIACARDSEAAPEREVPFERVPGGRAETGRLELGSQVKTRFGEGRLLRIAPFGTCRRHGDVEGRFDPDADEVRCAAPACAHPLEGVRERAIVAVEEREVYVDPAELARVDSAPYD